MDLFKKMLMEFMGVFFLVMSVVSSSGEKANVCGLLVVIVYVGAPISGGQFNPAVTLSLFLLKIGNPKFNFTWYEAFVYMIVQIGAGICASLAAWLFAMPSWSLDIPTTLPVTQFNAVVAEFLYTFLLCWVVIVATTGVECKTSFQINLHGLAVGFGVGLTVYCGASSVASISGACFNPAVAVGPMFVHMIRTGSVSQWLSLWVYLVGEFAGAVVAALIQRLWPCDVSIAMHAVKQDEKADMKVLLE